MRGPRLGILDLGTGEVLRRWRARFVPTPYASMRVRVACLVPCGRKTCSTRVAVFKLARWSQTIRCAMRIYLRPLRVGGCCRSAAAAQQMRSSSSRQRTAKSPMQQQEQGRSRQQQAVGESSMQQAAAEAGLRQRVQGDGPLLLATGNGAKASAAVNDMRN